MHLVAGTSLKNGQYILNHILDQQGIGWTYRATQTDLNQTVLIKTLNPTLRSHPQFNQIRQDFVTRSRDLGRLRHPSLVKVFDIFQDQDMPFVVMEYLQGISLNDWMNDRPRTEAEVIQFLRQMTQVLNYLQQHNYCHGNLKPRNIIYRSESESKLESKYIPSTVVLVGFAPSFVLSEMIAKRNPYSAPELRSGSVDNRSDLYSLSGLLYYCLTQHPPLNGDSQSDRLPLLSLLKPGAQRLLRSGTQLNPDDRPMNADLWLAQLSKSRPAPAVPKVSAITQIQGPMETQLQEPQPIPKPVSEAATYLQDPDSASPLPRSSSTLPKAASTQIQPPQTSIQPPVQPPQKSHGSTPLDRAKTIRPEAALPANLPRYRTTPLSSNGSNANFSSNANSDADLVESMISGRVSMKRVPSEKSYRGAKYIRPGGLLPKLRTVQIVGAIGAILGLIFGLVLRLQASRRPGASFFHTGQSFPPREWKGTSSANETNSKDIFVEPSSAPTSSESAAPQTTPGKPAEPGSKFPTRTEPFSPSDAMVPDKNSELSAEDAKSKASKSP